MTATRVFLTGSTGFVGRHFVRHALEQDIGLICPVRNLADAKRLLGTSPNLELVEVEELSVISDDEILPLLRKCNSIVHLAGAAHIGKSDRNGVGSELFTFNVKSVERLASAARKTNTKTFIHMSSQAAVSGNSADYVIDDTTIEQPRTAYGRSKLQAEKIVSELAQNGILAVSLRPPPVIGPESRGNWHALQKFAAIGFPLPFASLDAARSYVSVASLVDAVAHLCVFDGGAEMSGNYCVADADTVSIAQVLRELRSGMGKSARLLPFPTGLFRLAGTVTGRQRQINGLTGPLVVDGSRFCQVFGWQSPHDLREQIRESGRVFHTRNT